MPALVGGASRWEEEEPLIAMLEPMEDIQKLEAAQRRGKPGMSMRRGFPESEAGMSVRQGFPKPDPSGMVAKTLPVSVTKPLGRAFVANDPGVIPAEILTETVREHIVCPVVSSTTDACPARSRGLFAMDLEMWPADISEETDETDVLGARKAADKAAEEERLAQEAAEMSKAQEGLKPDQGSHVEAYRGQDHDASWMLGDVTAADIFPNSAAKEGHRAWDMLRWTGRSLTGKRRGRHVNLVEDVDRWPVDAAVRSASSTARPVGELMGYGQLVMLDSGAFTHVCPTNFTPEVAMECSKPKQGGLMASGQPLICYGSKKARIQVWGDVVMELTYAVVDVARPLLFVGELQRHGWNIHFGQHSYLERGNKVVPLLRRGGLSYLAVKARRPQASWSESMCEVLTEAARHAKELDAHREEGEWWHVVEYCC